MGRVVTNGLGDLASVSGHVIPKTLKMVLDSSLLNVVKSGRKRQQETDSCINSREDIVVSFRAY